MTSAAITRALEGVKPGARSAPDAGMPEWLNVPTRARLASYLPELGVTGEAALVYCVWRWRYYLLTATSLPSCPRPLRRDQEFMNRRAWEVLDAHRDELPPLVDARKPRGAQ